MEPTSTSTRSNRPAAVLAIMAAIGGIAVLVLVAVLASGAPKSPPAAADSSTPSASVAISPTPSSTTSAFDPVEFVPIGDDSGVVTLEVPSGWVDVSGAGWTVDGEAVGLAVTAAPDVDAWYSTWGTPGVFVGVATSGFQPSPGDFSAVCTIGERVDRSTDVVRGAVQRWSACGDEASDFYVFSGTTVDGGVPILVQLVDVDGGGRAILDHIMDTLRIAQ